MHRFIQLSFLVFLVSICGIVQANIAPAQSPRLAEKQPSPVVTHPATPPLHRPPKSHRVSSPAKSPTSSQPPTFLPPPAETPMAQVSPAKSPARTVFTPAISPVLTPSIASPATPPVSSWNIATPLNPPVLSPATSPVLTPTMSPPSTPPVSSRTLNPPLLSPASSPLSSPVSAPMMGPTASTESPATADSPSATSPVTVPGIPSTPAANAPDIFPYGRGPVSIPAPATASSAPETAENSSRVKSDSQSIHHHLLLFALIILGVHFGFVEI